MGEEVPFNPSYKLKGAIFDGRTFSDDDLAELAGQVKQLSVFNEWFLANSQVTDKGVEKLVETKTVFFLDLRGTKITDASMSGISKHSSLRYLLLDNTQISDDSLESLSKLTNLIQLSVQNTRITQAGIKTLYSVLPKGSVIPKATDEPPADVAKRIRDKGGEVFIKKKGEFASTDGITPQPSEIAKIVCKNKKEVDDDLIKQFQGLTSLVVLDLEGTGVSDKGMTQIATLSTITSLNLSRTKVKNEGIKQLGSLTKIEGSSAESVGEKAGALPQPPGFSRHGSGVQRWAEEEVPLAGQGLPGG